MAIKLLGGATEVKKGLDHINEFYPYVSQHLNKPIMAFYQGEKNESSIEIVNVNDAWHIRFGRRCDFFRALGCVLTEGERFNLLHENAVYEKCGVMLDVSRDAAYTVTQLKEFFVWIALCGLNTCYLYMEDLYCLERYPYFGYLRGAYTQNELRELDDFANDLGIELIPCIQTLSHLATTLKWDYAQCMKDTANTLMVGQDETYEFIREMLSTLKETFRTPRIHIGMDEAMDLGTGKYLRMQGYTPQFELMMEHLIRVTQMAQEMGLVPIIWDDMFYRSKNKDLDYYDPSVMLNEDDIAQVPKNVQLAYWDYYHNTQEEYDLLLEKRKNFTQHIIFAGGIWKWNGWVPNYGKTFVSTHAALQACKNHRVDEILATMWGDNGAETALQTVWPGLVLFGQYAYGASVDDDAISHRCKMFTGLSLTEYRTIESLDVLPGCELQNLKTRNPSKYFLYQDLLLGAFDCYVGDKTAAHYKACALEIQKIAHTERHPVEFQRMLKLYECLAHVLARKSDWGVRVRTAYKQKDMGRLSDLCKELDSLSGEVDALHKAFVYMWCYGTKGSGLEVHDIRLGGLIGRINTVQMRLSAYINGEITELDELEQEILPFKQQSGDDDGYPVCNKYHLIATQNLL